jgi:XTP/dITP diphosphohydrolase
MKKRLIFATGNEGKMKEVRMILSDLDYDILSLKDIGFGQEIVEDGKTFEENAVIKATTIAKITNDIVLADDSGLEVDYMNKEPGIYSARFLGEETSYHIKNKYIIDQLENAVGEERSARFVCAIACAFPNGSTLTTIGTIEGIIGYEELGENGFGYDPIFMVPEYNCSTAQLSPEQKNRISHRGKALEAMKDLIHKELSDKSSV